MDKPVSLADCKKVQHVVIRRSADENTCAAVIAYTEKNSRADRDFLGAVKAALADWRNKTDDGKRAWRQSAEDFNVGDLSIELRDSGLVAELARQGVHKLFVETFVDSEPVQNWDFDTKLMEE